MATRSESLKDDLISKLPEEMQHRILEFLPSYEAVNSALLSKYWNGVWSCHQRLVIDHKFYLKCVSDHEDNKQLAFANIITDVLSCRAHQVKNFTLRIHEFENLPEQHDLDRWCVLLSANGVEELNLLTCDLFSLRLPVCVVSCGTIKRLKICGLVVENPLNIGSIFPNVTSLFLHLVSFENFDTDFTMPNLETIGFMECALKLENMIFLPALDREEDEWELVKPYWNTITTLGLAPYWLVGFYDDERHLVPEMFPTAMNLQTLRLYHFCLESGVYIELAVQLLRKSPNLCQLEIDASVLGNDLPENHKEAALRLLENPDSCCIDEDLEMLHTVKIESFGGTKLEMLFVKMLLSKSPSLDKLIITRGEGINASKASKIAGELLLLPRASQKAQVDFIIHCPDELVPAPDFWDNTAIALPRTN